MKIQTFTIVSGTSVCNAKCPYCISRMTPNQGVSFKLEDVDWINFRKACRLAQINNVSTVLITGKGEPLLYPERIGEFLKVMQEYDFPLIEIQTNALVIGRDFKKYEKHLKEWRKLGLNTIAISMVHYDMKKNKEIYTPDSDYIDLGEVVGKLHDLGYSVRFSCIMLKGFIDSVDEVVKLADYCKKLDVEQLTIRSVAVPDKAGDKEIYEWTKPKVLSKGSVIDISEYLNKNAVKLMTLDHGGIVYDYDGQNLCISDCLTIKPDSEDLRQLIFFPDGHLRYDWRYEGAILV